MSSAPSFTASYIQDSKAYRKALEDQVEVLQDASDELSDRIISYRNAGNRRRAEIEESIQVLVIREIEAIRLKLAWV